jgi:hypothetical protein
MVAKDIIGHRHERLVGAAPQRTRGFSQTPETRSLRHTGA